MKDVPTLSSRTSEIPTLSYTMKPEKDTPWGRTLPVLAIIGSIPPNPPPPPGGATQFPLESE